MRPRIPHAEQFGVPLPPPVTLADGKSYMSSSCDFHIGLHDKYLVFVFTDSAGRPIAPGSCGPTVELDDAARTIAVLDDIVRDRRRWRP